MKYDEALKVWGLLKLKESYWNREGSDWVEDSVTVSLNFNEGYACCNGYNEDCYCSMAESPSASVAVRGYYLAGKTQQKTLAYVEISSYDFDFATVLKEICEAADGSVTV